MQAHARQPTKHTASPNITPYTNQLTSNNELAIKSLQHPTPEWKSDQTPSTQDLQPSNSEDLNYPNSADGKISFQYIRSNLQTDPRNQITISRETNHIPTTPWEQIDDTFSNQGKSTPIDKSVTHLKNNAIRVKDSISHQQNTEMVTAHNRQQALRARPPPPCFNTNNQANIPGEYFKEYSYPG